MDRLVDIEEVMIPVEHLPAILALHNMVCSRSKEIGPGGGETVPVGASTGLCQDPYTSSIRNNHHQPRLFQRSTCNGHHEINKDIKMKKELPHLYFRYERCQMRWTSKGTMAVMRFKAQGVVLDSR